VTIPNHKPIPRIAICALFHQEARYMAEFIHFHELVGVSRFYLLNDQSHDDFLPVLRPFRERGLVRLVQYPLIHSRIQCDAYSHAIALARRDGDVDLLAVTDIDEFLWPVEPEHRTIQDALAAIPFLARWSALAAQWRCFGAGDETEYRARPVIERFQWRVADDSFHNQWSKSILNLRDGGWITPTPGDPHIFQAEFGTVDERGEQVGCPRENNSANLLRINHYFTKSRPEWEERHPLDRLILGGKYPRDESRWSGVQAMEVEDRVLWERFGGELSRRLAA